tara:strand:+ start:186 stop:641 length:456 start_codon:yes stop_codon:yes gene_type:complete
MKEINSKLLIRYDDFIDSKECQQFISIFNQSHPRWFRNTFVLSYDGKEILKKLHNYFNFFNFEEMNHLIGSNMEIVLWPTNSWMGPHQDAGDKLSFIIYLNDNYEGGETIVDGIEIKPKVGRLIIFSNGFYLHEVKKITKGKRYTLIAWYS